MSTDAKLLQRASRAWADGEIQRAQVCAHRDVRDLINEVLDWQPEDGVDELKGKVASIKEQLDVLVARVETFVLAPRGSE